MRDPKLKKLEEDIVAFWEAEFRPYIDSDGRAKITDERPVAGVVRTLLDITSYDSREARQVVSSFVEKLTHVRVTKFTRRKVLVAASENGVWASELTVVASLLLAAGYEVVVATETGKPPHILSVSLDPEFVDGALGLRVVSRPEAELAQRFLDPSTREGQLLHSASIVNLTDLIRPPLVVDYLERPRKTMHEFAVGIRAIGRRALDYDALVIAGGSGAVAGFSMNGGLQHLILAFDRLKKPIVAQCNGVFALVHAIDPTTRASILRNRFATTHSRTHEYRRGGWGWAKPNKEGVETWTLPGADGNPIIDSEPIVRDALGRNGQFLSPPATPYAVAVDAHIITARTTPDGAPATAALIAMLDGETPFTGRFFLQDEDGFKEVPQKQALTLDT